MQASALRCFAKAVLARKSVDSVVKPCAANAQIFIRNIKSNASPLVTTLDVTKLPDFEVSKDPKEWQYVERLIPLKIVPNPKKSEDPTPSGWIPPRAEGKTHPYFIVRTKNHMPPVYLRISGRGTKHVTVIRNIQGNIWQLEKDLRAYLESKITGTQYKHIASRVNEMCGNIRFRGDRVSYVKQWMSIKGF